MSKTERINVNITRIVSPTKFWLKFQIGNYCNQPNSHSGAGGQKANEHCLNWIKERAEWKCHLAFLVPVDSITWTLTAIDKFKTYAKQFEKLTVTIPNFVNSSTRSTPVILWGSRGDFDASDALEAEFDVWRNINLQMIFQGVARTNISIERFSSEHFLSSANDNDVCQMMMPKQNHANQVDYFKENDKRNGRKKAVRWLPTSPCSDKEFTGIAVFIDNKLEMYVQDLENQKIVELISYELTVWHKNRTKNPTKFWSKGDICVARRSNERYHRAEIQRVYHKQRKCLVRFVDFGCFEMLAFEHLSTHTKFIEVPIQTRKCHLWNVNLIADEQTVKAIELANRMICNQTSTFHIHDNIDPLHFDSAACSVRPLKSQLDLSSRLILCGLVQYRAHSTDSGKSSSVADEIHMEKRVRKKSDDAILKNSSELLTIEDFEQFYEVNNIDIPVKVIENITTDTVIDNRAFEIFDSPSKRCPFSETVAPDLEVFFDAHPFVDRITDHFTLLNVTELAFYCRPVYIMDPVTILIEPLDSQPPPIEQIEKQSKYFPMQEYSPCIAFDNYMWHRGIVWDKVSTNKYLILFVDTLEITEVSRKLIQKCPTELIGSKLQFAKAHLCQIKPNERMRARDICDELASNLLNKNLFAKVIGLFDNGVLDIKLFESKDARRTVYNNLIKKKFYQKIK